MFAENSGFNFEASEYFSKLKEQGRVQFWSFPPSRQPERGKGYQEFEMLDQVVERLAGKHAAMVKVTGRYIVRNAQDLIAEGCGDVRIDRHRKMGVAITGFFHCRTAFYMDQLRGLYSTVDDPKGVFIEHVLYQKLAELEDQKDIRLFGANPDYRGVSGSHGHTMARHPVKMKLRNIERKLLHIAGRQEFIVEY